jgi:hypothetical protein
MDEAMPEPWRNAAVAVITYLADTGVPLPGLSPSLRRRDA